MVLIYWLYTVIIILNQISTPAASKASRHAPYLITMKNCESSCGWSVMVNDNCCFNFHVKHSWVSSSWFTTVSHYYWPAHHFSPMINQPSLLTQKNHQASNLPQLRFTAPSSCGWFLWPSAPSHVRPHRGGAPGQLKAKQAEVTAQHVALRSVTSP